MKLNELIDVKKFKNDMLEFCGFRDKGGTFLKEQHGDGSWHKLKKSFVDDIISVLDSCRNDLETSKDIIKEKSDAELLSDCILLKLKEIGETEQKHYSHLKDSFFENKKRLLALHSRVCSLLDE